MHVYIIEKLLFGMDLSTIQDYSSIDNTFTYLRESDTWEKSGNKTQAMQNYRKSLEFNQDNTNAKKMLKKIEGQN